MQATTLCFVGLCFVMLASLAVKGTSSPPLHHTSACRSSSSPQCCFAAVRALSAAQGVQRHTKVGLLASAVSASSGCRAECCCWVTPLGYSAYHCSRGATGEPLNSYQSRIHNHWAAAECLCLYSRFPNSFGAPSGGRIGRTFSHGGGRVEHAARHEGSRQRCHTVIFSALSQCSLWLLMWQRPRRFISGSTFRGRSR